MGVSVGVPEGVVGVCVGVSVGVDGVCVGSVGVGVGVPVGSVGVGVELDVGPLGCGDSWLGVGVGPGGLPTPLGPTPTELVGLGDWAAGEDAVAVDDPAWMGGNAIGDVAIGDVGWLVVGGGGLTGGGADVADGVVPGFGWVVLLVEGTGTLVEPLMPYTIKTTASVTMPVAATDAAAIHLRRILR